MFFSLKNSVAKLIAFWAICLVLPVWAGHYTFDPILLANNNINANDTDLSLFEQGGQLPGTYQVDIFLGDEKVDSTNVTFHAVKSPTGEYSLQSCLTKEQLSRYGVDVDNYPELLPPEKIFSRISKQANVLIWRQFHRPVKSLSFMLCGWC